MDDMIALTHSRIIGQTLLQGAPPTTDACMQQKIPSTFLPAPVEVHLA